MNLAFWSLLLLCNNFAFAVKIPLRQQPHSHSLTRRTGNGAVSFHNPHILAASDSNDLDLDNVHDLIYIANVTIGGNDYPVQLDTGSSDLWIHGQSSPLPNSVQSTLTANLTYGVGWAAGQISWAAAEFAGIPIKNQSYLDVNSVKNPAIGYGAQGILGLGFTSLSTIDALVNQTGSAAGRSLLFNAFNENPNEANFISFALPRSTDPDHDVLGAITIGEYVEEYKTVASTGKIPTWPERSPRRWNVLLDAILIGDKTIAVSSVVSGAPSNKAVVMLDTGTSYTYAPPDACEAIYGGIEGARYDATARVWFIPCKSEVDIALQFNNQAFPIHPLDVSPYNYPDNDTCIGSFIPQSVAVGSGQFDWLIGDNVLRSIYSVYDFGDFDSTGKMGNPYVQLLSIVDPNQASLEFATVRGSVARSNITYHVTPTPNGGTVSAEADLTSTLDKLSMYIPAMLAIMALNAVVVILLIIVAIVYLCRRRQGGASARKNRGRSSPMPLNPIATGSSQAHTYEPVSMALTEDTYVPTSPGFHKGSFSGKRPRSYQPTSVAMSEDSFVPPMPAFFREPDDGLRIPGSSAAERPNSVA